MNDLILEQRTAGKIGNKSRRKKGNRMFLLFICIWMLMIASGIAGAKLYMDHMQQSLAADLERQTAGQITAMQQAYESRMLQMETTYAADLAELKTKVDALNELLTFTKDNAASKTDNSNKLYSQLNEVKKQLAELKKNLDVLK